MRHLDWQTKLALRIGDTPLHSVLRFGHRKLARYMDLAGNWNNGDEATNGEAFLVHTVGAHLRVAFDIGANIGKWSGMLLQANPHCLLYAFEPSARNFARLQQGLAGRPNVKLFQMGVGDRPGRVVLHEYAEDVGLSTFIPRHESIGLNRVATHEAAVVTLDQFCREHQTGPVDFVKVDTEGYELRVFRGMKEGLRERTFSLIQFEYGGTWLDAQETLQAAWDLFNEFGYSLYRLHRQGVEKIQFSPAQHECFKYSNFLAASSPDILVRWGIPLVASR